MSDLLEKITEILDQEDQESDSDTEQKKCEYYGEDTLQFNDMKVEVEGIGELSMPITRDEIKKLLKKSSLAKFGHRDKTLFDKNVRNTNEISSDKVNVTYKNNSLTRIMNKFRADFGLPENSQLVPYLYNMLVYAPGQFFDYHRDTEKVENMIATLVIVLPHPHIGGDLLIAHGSSNKVFSSQCVFPQDIKCISFFSSCSHKIEKVIDGHRVVLTYNVALAANNVNTVVIEENVNEDLKKATLKYFKANRKDETAKFVYILDHKYTQNSLKWHMLKGVDRPRAYALRKVAENINVPYYLVLLDICKAFTADAGPGDTSPEPDEFLHAHSEVSYCIDKYNKFVPIDKYEFRESEFCELEEKELDSFEVNSEYEGYLGNGAGGLTKSYEVAAIVVSAKPLK